jgi:ribosome-associated translation inhibitor RaiA
MARSFRGETPNYILKRRAASRRPIRANVGRGSAGAGIARHWEGDQIMQITQQPFAVRVHTGWIDFSPALQSYAAAKVTQSLGSFACRIRSVEVRIAEYEPQKPATRLCAIEVELKPVGVLSTTATGHDPYALVDEATNAIVARLRNQRRVDGSEALPRIA